MLYCLLFFCYFILVDVYRSHSALRHIHNTQKEKGKLVWRLYPDIPIIIHPSIRPPVRLSVIPVHSSNHPFLMTSFHPAVHYYLTYPLA